MLFHVVGLLRPCHYDLVPIFEPSMETLIYLCTLGRFPKTVEMWSRQGELRKVLAELPLAENIPIDFDSCRKGPRSHGWRSDKPCEMYWIECQDEGDPSVDVSPRDIIYTLSADVSRPRKTCSNTLLGC